MTLTKLLVPSKVIAFLQLTKVVIMMLVSYWRGATIKPEISKVFKNHFWPVHMKKHTWKPLWSKICNLHILRRWNNRFWNFKLENLVSRVSVTWLHQSQHVIYQNDRVNVGLRSLERYFEKYRMVARKSEITDFQRNFSLGLFNDSITLIFSGTQ